MDLLAWRVRWPLGVSDRLSLWLGAPTLALYRVVVVKHLPIKHGLGEALPVLAGMQLPHHGSCFEYLLSSNVSAVAIILVRTCSMVHSSGPSR